MYKLRLTFSADLALCVSIVVAVCLHFATASANENLTSSQIQDDFGPYSENVTQEAQEKLTLLGDWDGSVQNLNEAINNFYNRTRLPGTDNSLQQLIDINMVISAEREANRALRENNSAEMQSYAYTIAPWLDPSATRVEETTGNDIQVNKPNDNSTPLATVIDEPSIKDMLAEQTALNAAITSLDSTLDRLANTVENLY